METKPKPFVFIDHMRYVRLKVEGKRNMLSVKILEATLRHYVITTLK